MKLYLLTLGVIAAWLPAAAWAQNLQPRYSRSMPVLEASSVLDPALLEPEEPYAVQDLTLFKKQPRPGMLQGVYFATTRIMADTDQLSMVEFDISATLGFPMPTRESPLLLTPSLEIDSLDVDSLDLPNELYDATIDFRYLRPVNERLTVDLGVRPGVYGNMDSSQNEFRVQGRAIALYQWRPTIKTVLGIVYLDRNDISLLPAVGLIWQPNDHVKLDLLFPKPRLAFRGPCTLDSAWWLYVGGELGGGSWGVTRATGVGDVATLRDLRLLFGIERESNILSFRVEAGFVFSRELEYASGIGDTNLDNGGVLRAVLAY